MRWNTTIYLITSTIEVDNLRNQKPVKVKRMVYANLRAMRFSAKLAAGIDDYDKIKTFELMTQEYAGEEKLEFDGYEHDILDVSPKGDRTIITAKRQRKEA